MDDENLSPFDTLPDSDLLSGQKGREHSPVSAPAVMHNSQCVSQIGALNIPHLAFELGAESERGRKDNLLTSMVLNILLAHYVKVYKKVLMTLRLCFCFGL